MVSIGFSPGVRLAAFCSARDRSLVAVHRENGGALRQGKREGAQAAEEVDDALGFADGGGDEAHHLRLGGGCRLQERAGRQHDVGGAEAHGRNRRLVERVAGQRQAGKLQRGCLAREELAQVGRRIARHVLDGDVEPIGGKRHDDTRPGARRDISGSTRRRRPGRARTMADAVTGHSCRSTMSTPFAS